MDNLKRIVDEVAAHHSEFPSHGADCACMDKYIQELRRLTNVDDTASQRRVDYVMASSVRNRPVLVLGDVKHSNVNINGMTATLWRQMTVFEREQWEDFWNRRGHVYFSCHICGFPVAGGGAPCNVCDPVANRLWQGTN